MPVECSIQIRNGIEIEYSKRENLLKHSLQFLVSIWLSAQTIEIVWIWWLTNRNSFVAIFVVFVIKIHRFKLWTNTCGNRKGTQKVACDDKNHIHQSSYQIEFHTGKKAVKKNHWFIFFVFQFISLFLLFLSEENSEINSHSQFIEAPPLRYVIAHVHRTKRAEIVDFN